MVMALSVSLKGGFFRPTLGLIKNFWLEAGMEKLSAM